MLLLEKCSVLNIRLKMDIKILKLP